MTCRKPLITVVNKRNSIHPYSNSLALYSINPLAHTGIQSSDTCRTVLDTKNHNTWNNRLYSARECSHEFAFWVSM